MKLIITIPAFNEETTLGNVIDSIKKVMKGTKYKYSLLVVNDGSTDNTVSVAKSKGAIVVSHSRNYGLAETFKTEMQKCIGLGADVIVHTDADGQYRAEDIPKLLAKLEEGHDLVLGSRFAGHIESMPLIKRIGNRLFSKVLSKLTRTKITDGQTGFRAFTREVAMLPINSTYTYTQEQLMRAAKSKMRIAEIPVYAKKTRESRLMKNPLEYAFKSWVTIIRVYRDYEPLKLFGTIGALFFFAGIAIGVWLLYLVLVYGKIGHLPSTILSMLLIVTGIQIALFGLLADMQRK